jgi:flagellin-specific chaperone FliS
MKRVKAEIEKIDNAPTKLLQYLSETHQKAMKDASEFLKETNSFLDTSITRAQNDIGQLKSNKGGTVEFSIQAIKSELAQLRSLVTEIRG